MTTRRLNPAVFLFRPRVACKTKLCEAALNRLRDQNYWRPVDCSKAQRENRAQVRDREPAFSAPAGFAFLGRADPLLLLRFKATLFGGTGKSGRPPPLEPSLKVQRDIVHNQSSGFAVARRVTGNNTRGPSKVHPKWRLEESVAGRPTKEAAA